MKQRNYTEAREKADKIVLDARGRNRFRGDVSCKPNGQRPCFSGEIQDLKHIKIEYNPSYPLHEVPYDNAFDCTLDAVVEHEVVHKGDGQDRGCPGDGEIEVNNILIPISKVLKSKGYPNAPFGNQGHTLYTYFANLFGDYVVNTIGCDNRGSRGFFLVYDDQGQHSDGFGDLFEGFLKLQAMSFPRVEGVHMMLKYFKHSDKVKKAVKNFLKRTGLREIPKQKRVSYLANPDNWKKNSRIFAEEFSDLVDLSNLQVCYFPIFGGNDFSRLNDEDVQMEFAGKSYDASSGSFAPPIFMEENLALLALYRKFAKNMEIKVNSYSVETERPVSMVSRRRFDFERDDIENLVFGLNERGRIEMQTGKYPLRVKSRYQISAGTFPEVRIGLFDCSGSTTRSITGEKGKVMNPWATEDKQWTDTSIYHQELLCGFGLWELFRRRGILKHAGTKLGVFSDTTRIGRDLGESEKLALQPSFGGTSLSEPVLEEFFDGSGSLVYTISDGEISNWRNVKDKFIKGAKKHHYFHLQIGRRSQMYNDLKREGLKAILDDGRNSSKVLIDLTQEEIFKK